MSKKSFTKKIGTMDSDLFGTMSREEHEQKQSKNKEKRATFIVEEPVLEKLKAIAFWERKKNKEVLHEALIDYISKYENKKGNVNIPQK